MISQGDGRKLPALLISEAVFALSIVFVTVNPIYAQTSEESPLSVVFAIEGVDANTGEMMSWVTLNNVTKTLFYNATAIDLEDTLYPARDGTIELSITLPNGTAQVGDKFRACTTVPEFEKLVCNTGFNSPTDRAEFMSILLSSFKKQE
jgi:hypothetical protein